MGMQSAKGHRPSSVDDVSEVYPEEYSRLAEFIAHDADKSTTVSRRFERLSRQKSFRIMKPIFSSQKPNKTDSAKKD